MLICGVRFTNSAAKRNTSRLALIFSARYYLQP